jgi:aminopeptidase N
MAAAEITRDECARRAELLQVRGYDLTLDLTAGDRLFRSTSVISFDCAEPGAASHADLVAEQVHEITLNGVPINKDQAWADGRIALAGLERHNQLRVVADCRYSRDGTGLHRFTDPADGRTYTYTKFEPAYARTVFACFEQPDLKAPVTITVRVPSHWTVLSNEPAGRDQPSGASAGQRTWRYPPTKPLSTYLVAVVAGEYNVLAAEHTTPRGQRIGLRLACRASLTEWMDAEDLLDSTRRGLDYFTGLFERDYPFAKYDQAFVPEFSAGATESAACVVLSDRLLFRSHVTDAMREQRASVVLHEMAHMWFGDMVTMRWWDDLWLNESFATWASLAALTEATRWPDAWTAFAQGAKAYAYRQDQLPSTHPIAADIEDIEAVEVNFDGITYEKGAAVLKQLVAYVGQDRFLAGMRDYFGAHAWGNATLADLLGALERQSGRDLTAWSKSWLETAGVNTLRPAYEVGDNGSFTSFSVLQDAPPSHPELRPHRIAVGLYDRAGGTLMRRHRVEVDIAGADTAVPELLGQARPDLILVNDDDLSYAKVRLDEHSLRTAITHIGGFAESLPATLCWAAAWDMTRDAELSTQDFLALVRSGAPSIGQIPVLEGLLAATGQALRRYADPAWRPQACATFDDTVRGWLLAAEPGSDHQLAYAQALAREATTGTSLGLLAGLLDGTAAVGGLAVDTELRWQFLRRLVSRGVAGPDAVAAELALDPTDAGQRRAQTCLAAVPTAGAKEQAWAAITGGSLPNATFRAALRGFADLDQDELLAPYAERFYAALPAMWADGASDMAQFFTKVGYPASVISQRAIDRSDAYLEQARPAPALARLLSEGRDDVARAVRCRERSVQASRSQPGHNR